MKKAILSLAFIAAFGVFTAHQYFGQNLTNYTPALPVSSPVSSSGQPSSSNNTGSAGVQKAKTGKYTDGTYVGQMADAYYGNVQVEVVISGGSIKDVKFLQYPNDRSTSRFINGQAMPILTSEAIQSQNSSVDIVSGATDTSSAFQESLSSALSQAQA